MIIGSYVSVVAGEKGFENNVSGHIQVPLEAMSLLRDAGHDVHLVTNAFGEGRTLPDCLRSDIPVHYVDDARDRGGILDRSGSQGSGISPRTLLRQVGQIKSLAREHGFDVLHLFGYNRTAQLGGALRWMGLPCPAVATMFGARFPERFSLLTRRLWNRLDTVVTGTEFVREQYAEQGIDAKLVRHGIIRDLRSEIDVDELEAPHRVLFWRDPSVENGCDVALAAYDRLAADHPDVSFDMALRPHWNEVPGIEDVERRHANVHIHRFPYEDGVTLPKLLFESICVVMPSRVLSIDPQLVIAESLAAGIPIIATQLRSNPEFITDGVNGRLVPVGDVDATTDALAQLLQDRDATAIMGQRAAADLGTVLTWDRYVEEIVAVYEHVIAG